MLGVPFFVVLAIFREVPLIPSFSTSEILFLFSLPAQLMVMSLWCLPRLPCLPRLLPSRYRSFPRSFVCAMISVHRVNYEDVSSLISVNMVKQIINPSTNLVCRTIHFFLFYMFFILRQLSSSSLRWVEDTPAVLTTRHCLFLVPLLG